MHSLKSFSTIDFGKFTTVRIQVKMLNRRMRADAPRAGRLGATWADLSDPEPASTEYFGVEKKRAIGRCRAGRN